MITFSTNQAVSGSPLFWIWIILLALPPGVQSLIQSYTGLGTGFVLFLIFNIICFECLTRKHLFHSYGMNFWILLSISFIYFFSSLVHNAHDPGTRSAIYQFFIFLLTYYASSIFMHFGADKRKIFNIIIDAVFTSLLLTSVISYFQYFFFNMREYLGFVDNANHFGYLMATGFAISVSSSTINKKTLLHRFLPLLFLGSTIISMSRGAYLSILLIILTYIFLKKKFIVPIASLTILIIAFYSNDLIQSRFNQVDISSGRYALWEVILPKNIGEVLFGNGAGYMWSLNQFDISQYGGFISDKNTYIYAHNDFLFLLIEIGITGSILWLVFLLNTFLNNRKTFCYNPSSDIIFYLLCVLIVGQNIDTIFFGSYTMLKIIAILPGCEIFLLKQPKALT